MKYKLLKDYPQLKAGCIGYPADKANYDYYIFEQDGKRIHIDRDLVELTDEWFEPVIERWKAEPDESYFQILNDLKVSEKYHRHWDNDRCFDAGNYFKTREQAEEASRRIKKVLMDYHKEIGE